MNVGNLPKIDTKAFITPKSDEVYNHPSLSDRPRRVKAKIQPDKALSRNRIGEICKALDASRYEWRHLDYMGLARVSAIWQMWGKPSLKSGHTGHQQTGELGRMLQEYIGGVPRIGLALNQVYDSLIAQTQRFVENGRLHRFDWFESVQVEYDLIETNRLAVTLYENGGVIWGVDVIILKAVVLMVAGMETWDKDSTGQHEPNPMWVGQFFRK